MSVTALDYADAHYRRSTVESPGAETIVQGIHGVVVYLLRARASAEGKTWKDGVTPAMPLAKADRLLVFMSRLADPLTDLGRCLIECYESLQRCITILLAGTDDMGVTDAIDTVIAQAKAIEYDLESL